MAHSYQVCIVNQDNETGKIAKKSLEAVFHNNSKAAEQKAQELEKGGNRVIIEMNFCKQE